MAADHGSAHPVDEAELFQTLCELDPDARTRRLRGLDRDDPALAARLRRLLEIDAAYGAHTARNVLGAEAVETDIGSRDIGPFRLLRQIGRGGMGVVYLAERRSGFEQRVALKIMPGFAPDASGRERFARERRILAQLRHPNICSILDGGELDDGSSWLAMEYVPGEPLSAWCARRGTDLRGRVSLFLQLCDAVQYAHRNLVIHRDLKDSNVLVDENGRVKLLDFGIAKWLSAASDDGHTAAQDRFFSPMTAAPEQIRGERATVGTDVYALGTLLHQLLCGLLPFERPPCAPLELQRRALEAVPPRMSDALRRDTGADGAGDDGAARARALRGELDAIVAHCLRKQARERYAEVGDLVRDLRAWLSGHPISIGRDDRLYRCGKFLRRHRLAVGFGTLAAAGLCAALAVTLWQASALRRERDAADTARQRSEVDRDRARAVAGFMRETFEQADPGRASEGGLLARELIERGKRRLDHLDGQPAVQAELALLLAESDASLGLVRESDATWRAHAAGIQALSATDPELRWRAQELRLSNRLVLEADGPGLDAALAGLRRLADTPARKVKAARLQERLHVRRSEFGRAARTLEDAWQRYGASLRPADALALRVDLGFALLSAERDQDAHRIYAGIDREALRAYEPALQIRALRLIARGLQLRGTDRKTLVGAVGDWQRTAERLYGEDSLEAARAYVWAVGVTDDTRAQDALMHKAYEIQRAKLAPQSAARAHAEFNMAIFQSELRRRPDLAEPHLAQAVESGRAALSRAHGDVRRFELAWAETLNALGRHRQCLRHLSGPPGEPQDLQDASRLSALRLALAEAAMALGRPAAARGDLAAIRTLWARLGQPPPAALSARIRALERRLGAGPTTA